MALAALLVFVAVQLAIPISRLDSPDRAQRLGWQMFAVAAEPIQFTVLTASGENIVQLDDIMARVRGDIDLPTLLPPFLCMTVEGALAVSWHHETYTCSPS